MLLFVPDNCWLPHSQHILLFLLRFPLAELTSRAQRSTFHFSPNTQHQPSWSPSEAWRLRAKQKLWGLVSEINMEYTNFNFGISSSWKRHEIYLGLNLKRSVKCQVTSESNCTIYIHTLCVLMFSIQASVQSQSTIITIRCICSTVNGPI